MMRPTLPTNKIEHWELLRPVLKYTELWRILMFIGPFLILGGYIPCRLLNG